MTLEEQLRALIDSAPSHIQRHFACDCAERALRLKAATDKRSWDAIETGRKYAEGKATEEELRTAKDAAADAALNTVWDSAWANAFAAERSAMWTAERASMWAAKRSSERVAMCGIDLEWQIAHIQSLLAAHNAARSSLLSILQHRAEMIQKVLPRNAQTLEEALFT